MQLGFVSAILPDLDLDGSCVRRGARLRCVEVMCWPVGKAERRYAGVTHLDVIDFDDAKAASREGAGCTQRRRRIGAGLLPQSARPPTRPKPARRHRAPQEGDRRRSRDAGARRREHVHRPRPGEVGRRQLAALRREVWPAIVEHAEQAGVRDRHRELPDAVHRRRVAGRQEPARSRRPSGGGCSSAFPARRWG